MTPPGLSSCFAPALRRSVSFTVFAATFGLADSEGGGVDCGCTFSTLCAVGNSSVGGGGVGGAAGGGGVLVMDSDAVSAGSDSTLIFFLMLPGLRQLHCLRRERDPRGPFS